MTFDDYQKKAQETALGPATNTIIYPALGLGGETGEVVEKVKKLWRDHSVVFNFEMVDDPELVAAQQALALEIGDVLWYLSMLATNLGLDMSEVAQLNLDKLADRQKRDVLQGEGDDR